MSKIKNVEDLRVVQVEIVGNDIQGVLSDGTTFSTYAPNDPNLVEKLSDTELIKLTKDHEQAILENNKFLDNFEQHFDILKI